MARRSDAGPNPVRFAIGTFLEGCRTPNTRAAYGADLDHFSSWCQDAGKVDLSAVKVEDIARYRAACEGSGAAPATVARRLSAIASFHAFAAASGAGSALLAGEGIERPVLAATSSAEVLDDADADSLLAAADGASDRSAALIRLLLLDGLKVGEAAGANAEDLAGRSPSLRLTVGDRASRTVTLHPESSRALHRYLGRRREGPLLLSERRGRGPERLSRFGIDFLVKQAALAAGFERAISGNTLRRRYVIVANEGGTDLAEIRDNAGHADERTTRRYLIARDTGPA